MIIERTGFVDVDKIKNDINRLYISEYGWLYLYICYSNVYKCDIVAPIDCTLTIITDYEYDFDKMVYTPVYKRIYDCRVSDFFTGVDLNKLKKVEVYEQNGKVENDFVMR